MYPIQFVTVNPANFATSVQRDRLYYQHPEAAPDVLPCRLLQRKEEREVVVWCQLVPLIDIGRSPRICDIILYVAVRGWSQPDFAEAVTYSRLRKPSDPNYYALIGKFSNNDPATITGFVDSDGLDFGEHTLEDVLESRCHLLVVVRRSYSR